MISVTGFTADTYPTREEVKCAIDTMGACYLGSLCKDISTHLVCANNSRKRLIIHLISSDKYHAAALWKGSLKIVRVEWLLACLRQWKRVNEDEYSLNGSCQDDILTGDEDESVSDLQGEDRVIVDNLFTTDPSSLLSY